MAWNVESQAHETFARNPLVIVVAQARFHPILKIGGSIGEFQDRVRHHFPGFERGQASTVELRDFASIRVGQEETFTFRRPADGAAMVLTKDSLTVEYRSYRTRQELQRDFTTGWTALCHTQHHVQALRLGLRYINVLRLGEIARDLQRDLRWTDVVNSECLRAPGFEPVDDDMLFSGEVAGPVPSGGAMTLRYGRLASAAPPRQVEFRIDVDRYLDGYDGSTDPADLLDCFANDVFATFRRFAGPALDEWMRDH